MIIRPAAVYRLFDADDRLLYVGVTENVKARFSHHASSKPWWPDVARHTVEWMDNRDDAEAAEKLAISTEMPVWNVRDSPCPPKRPVEPWLQDAMDAGDVISVSAARSDLTELVASVRFQRRVVVLLGSKLPRAAIVPVELAAAIRAVGGADEAVKILRAHGAA
jgi:hypothetical protein